MPTPMTRTMVLNTAAAADLVFLSMTAREEMSRLFEFEIVALSDNAALSADTLLGTAAKVAVQLGSEPVRWFHGIVTAFGIDGSHGRRHRYRLTLRPWLWLLTRSSDLRIFQDQTALEIVQAVFADYTHTVAVEISGSLPQRPYCVQYRESDFDFVSRLLEDEGVNYYFRHSQNNHELVLCNTMGAHAAAAGAATVAYIDGGAPKGDTEAIDAWRMQHEIQSGAFALRDFNFETPAADLQAPAAAASRQHAEAAHEVYDYPGRHAAKPAGETRAAIRRDEAQSRFARYRGSATVPGLAAGCSFTMSGPPRADQNTEYLVLSTQIEMEVPGLETAGAAREPAKPLYRCQLLAQPTAEPLRPQRLTPRPTVAGPQTALVVGSGDPGDIHTDEHGRVKLQFHWDRLGAGDASSSCWVRVAMPSAGNGWGQFSLPRLGQEVVVDFLEGDPDQPLVTGRVHNALQKTPYALPAHATVSTWKSRSKLGAADKFNEIRFEDADGSEYLLLHAQKDRFEIVEDTLKSKIDKFEHRTVLEDRKEKIAGEHHLQVGKDVKVKYGQKFHLKVEGAMQVETADKYNLKAAQDLITESGTKISSKAGTDMHLKIGQNLGADAGMNVHIKGGMNIVIEAGMQVTIKAGPSSVVLGPDGVSITGPMVKINSGGSAGSGGGASPTAPTAPEAPADPELPEDPLSHR